MLEDRQPRHQPRRQRRAAGHIRIDGSELLLEEASPRRKNWFGRPELAGRVFALPLSRARRVKGYSASASVAGSSTRCMLPSASGFGKGKAHKPYEFGVKVSVATPLNRCGAASLSPT